MVVGMTVTTENVDSVSDTNNQSKFYMTYARSRPNELVPWIEEHNVPLLTNAVHRWSDATERLLPMWEYDTPHVIDAGGYNVQAQHADLQGNVTQDPTATLQTAQPFYKYTLEEYHEWLDTHKDEFEWATAMDYACEERFDGLWSVEDRVQATLDNTIDHFDLYPDYKVLPVLQGRSVELYVECYDYLKDHGIPVDHVGLGTVCRLSSEKRIVEVEQQVREQTNVEKIHGFGVKVAAYKHGATFTSGDSQAWVYGASNGRVYRLNDTESGGLRLDEEEMPNDSLTRTVHSFKSYYAYVTWLKEGTTALDDTQIEAVIETDAEASA